MSLIFVDGFDHYSEAEWTGWSFRDEDLECIARGANQAGALAAELLKARKVIRAYEELRTVVQNETVVRERRPQTINPGHTEHPHGLELGRQSGSMAGHREDCGGPVVSVHST